MKKTIIILASVLVLAALGIAILIAVQGADTEISLSGVSISASDFGKVFSGDSEERTVQLSDCSAPCKLDVKDISILDEEIRLEVTVQNGGQSHSLPITGKLSSSFKLEDGINSVIVEVNSKVKGYEVLLFEIFNDTEEDILLLESGDGGDALQGVPHIKIYLQDDQDQVYLFEGTLPECFSDLKASDYSKANSQKDSLLWSIDLVTHSAGK